MSTRKDVERTFARMAHAAAGCGLDVAGWQLHPGSTTYGVAWTIITGLGGSSDVVGLPPFGAIGKTASDADRFLSGMAAAFESIAHAERRKDGTR